MEHGSNLPQVESDHRSLAQPYNLDDNWVHVKWFLTTATRLTRCNRPTNGFRRMTHFSPDGTAYRLEGPAHLPSVVLCHGVGLDLHMWEAQVNALWGRFQVLRYDMLGHGRTAPAERIEGIFSFVEQLVQLLEHLAIDRVHLVGLSMGGVIAQAFAGQFSARLKTLTLMNTVYRRSEAELKGMHERLQTTKEQGLAPIAQAAIERWFDDDFKFRKYRRKFFYAHN